MAKAAKPLRRGRVSRKGRSLPLSAEARELLRLGAESEEQGTVIASFGDVDDNSHLTLAQQRLRERHMDKRMAMDRALRERCDRLVERFDSERNVTITDVMTLAVASLYSGKARGAVAPALLRVAGLLT